MAIKEEFREFLEHHPRMSPDKPGPKRMYVELMEQGSAMDVNLQKLKIPGFTIPYECTNPTIWANVIKPVYEHIYHGETGKKPMQMGTYWNHWATMNKFIEFLNKDNIYRTETYDWANTDTPILVENDTLPQQLISDTLKRRYSTLLSALRTKPFLLLAGISGTGKSQKVQELAYMSCPKELQDKKGTTPGNYCLIEVKPNWHDSTELLGYYSALSEKYMLTDFVRFAYKALQHEDVPFFLCLDEMNLAPVEQYFAEYLSVLETRKLVDGEIESQPLLSAEKFANCKVNVEEPNAVRQYPVLDGGEPSKEKTLYSAEDAEIITYLKENGLALPSNLFVIGTVNMDDTTHQFSRKVIDRAFTIEMNGGKMEDMFSEESKLLLSYREEPIPLAAFQSRFVKAYEVLDDAQFSRYADDIKTKIPSLLGNPEGEYNTNSINGVLSGTPFRVSYRVQNELVLYLSTLIEGAGYPENIDGLIREAVLAILLQKILPRVQGEESQLKTNGGHSNILADLKSFVQIHLAPIPAPQSAENDSQEIAEVEATEPSASAAPSSELYHQVIKKLDEMEAKLVGYYTNFF